MWAKHTRTTSASSVVPFVETRHWILSPRPMSPPALALVGCVRLRQWAGSDTRTPHPAESSTVSKEGPGQLGHVRLREMRRTSPCLKGVLEFRTVIDSIAKRSGMSVLGVRVSFRSTDWLRTEETEHVIERPREYDFGAGNVAAGEDNASEAESGEVVNDKERNEEHDNETLEKRESEPKRCTERDCDMSGEIETERVIRRRDDKELTNVELKEREKERRKRTEMLEVNNVDKLTVFERVSGRDIVNDEETVSDGARVVVSLGVPAVADALGLSLGVAVGLLEGVSLGLSEWVLGRDIVLADEAVSDGARVVVSLGVPAVADALGLSLGVAVGLLEGVSLGLSEWVLGRDIVLANEAVSDGARVVVSLGVPAVADALGLSLGVAVGLLEGVSLGLSEWVLGRDIVLANEAVSDGARVVVSLGVPAVADALGLSLGVAVGLLEGVSLGLSEWVLGRDIVLADEAVPDGARVVVSLGVPAVADALGLSLGVAVGLLEGVSLGLSEWVLGRDIVLANEAVSDGARVVVSLGVPAVADALGLSLGVAVGLLEGVSLGLSEWVLGRDIVLANEAVSDGARVVVSLGVPAVADALGLSLGVAVGLLEGVSLGLSEWVLGRDIVLADEAVSDGARVVVSLGVPAVADALGLSLGVAVGVAVGLLEGVSLGLSEWVLGRDIVLADEAVSDGARVVVSLGVPAVADALGLSLGVAGRAA